ncbi:MAG: iron-containing redox enzyme family protein [Candidatus Nitrosocosmicus sp.]|nr:iron-containing redox enzyme family protein [Candidatus Nitrosocosmicus sp.]MDN5866765.1 iron-containing redox enzyme family protein [Candidatus Nitrosocosmicus sp.]
MDQINTEIEKSSLLKHKFYQMWQEGKLTLDHLAGYSKEYYQLVKNVPNLVENTLINNRNERYENLIKSNLSEERDHIEPWIRFASSLNVSPEELNEYSEETLTTKAIDDLVAVSKSSFEEGVASLYAFEKELPKISETKSKGLKQFYNKNDADSHRYFDIHKEADIYHAKVWENILNECSEDKHPKILNAVKISLAAQNKLLDSVHIKYVEKN